LIMRGSHFIALKENLPFLVPIPLPLSLAPFRGFLFVPGWPAYGLAWYCAISSFVAYIIPDPIDRDRGEHPYSRRLASRHRGRDGRDERVFTRIACGKWRRNRTQGSHEIASASGQRRVAYSQTKCMIGYGLDAGRRE